MRIFFISRTFFKFMNIVLNFRTCFKSCFLFILDLWTFFKVKNRNKKAKQKQGCASRALGPAQKRARGGLCALAAFPPRDAGNRRSLHHCFYLAHRSGESEVWHTPCAPTMYTWDGQTSSPFRLEPSQTLFVFFLHSSFSFFLIFFHFHIFFIFLIHEYFLKIHDFFQISELIWNLE